MVSEYCMHGGVPFTICKNLKLFYAAIVAMQIATNATAYKCNDHNRNGRIRDCMQNLKPYIKPLHKSSTLSNIRYPFIFLGKTQVQFFMCFSYGS